MKKTIIYITIMLLQLSIFAQNDIPSTLLSVEENNTELKALREEHNALKLSTKTDIYLANPEVEFNYLWGKKKVDKPRATRVDFKITQTFDFTTISGRKSNLSKQKNLLLDLEYEKNRIGILYETKLICLDLIYYNALEKELSTRLSHASTIANAYQERLKNGDANILEYNKLRLNLASIECEMSRITMEKHSLLNKLQQLNGGITIEFNEHLFPDIYLPGTFEELMASTENHKNPQEEYLKQQIEESKRELSVIKASRLPSLTLGYMTEQVKGHEFQGITAGISLPLWENKNKVKTTKQEIIASESRQYNYIMQYHEFIKDLYQRSISLQSMTNLYKKSMENANSSTLLKQALDAGEISLLEYILEIDLYYSSIEQMLDTERNFQKTHTELTSNML